MHSLNKYLVLNVIMILGIMQPMLAGLAAATDCASAAQPASLAQATAQSHASAASLAQAAEQAKPSTVALAIGQIEGVQVLMTTQFTPEEIDKYPGYEQAFAVHAATHLESENPADIAAIEHFIEKHPNFAAFLDGRASKSGPINNNVRKRLNKANRQPIMSRKIATEVVKDTVIQGIAWTTLFAMQEGAHSGNMLEVEKLALAEHLLKGAQRHELEGLIRVINTKTIAHKKNLFRSTDRHFSNFVEELPRAIPIAVGTAALSSVALREFDELIGDPFPTPKYDPKSNNISHYSHIAAKWTLRNFVVPFVLGKYIVTPAFDKTVNVLSGTHNE